MKLDKPWKRVAYALGGLALLELGARIAAPGLNVDALTQYLRNGGGSWLMSLYNQLGGGGLARGAVLALGIMPYLSAAIMVRLANSLNRSPDRLRMSRWTRALAVGLAGVQAWGFTRFLENIPGAVTHPGIAFTLQNVLLMTTGTVVTMVVSEQIGRALRDHEDEDDAEPDERHADAIAASPMSSPALGDGAAQPVTVPHAHHTKVR